MSILNIEIKQGSEFERVITVENQDGTPRDLTGLEYVGHLRKAYDSTEITASFVFVVPDQTTNPGKIFWSLPHASLVSLNLARTINLVYDIEELSTDGKRRELFRGIAAIIPEVTK